MKLAPNMWLDASDPTTLYDATVGGNLVTNGGTVARWEDKSGNVRHATQGTSTRRPRLSTNQINNKNAILFRNTGYPTTDTFMNAGIVPSTMASNHTVFAVFKCMGPSLDFANETPQGIFLREGYHKGLIIDGLRNQFPTNVVGNTWQGTSFVIQASLATADLSTTTVAGYSMELTPTIQINLRVNNNTKIVTSISTSPHNLGNVYIGRQTAGSTSNNYNWPFNGYICELLYFTRVLTDIERTNLTYYLYDKWGIPLPDPDAAAYFARIEAAGSTINPNNRNAVNALFLTLKAQSIWTLISELYLFAGVDNLTGCLVKAKGSGSLSNTSFVSGDHNRTTGLLGDGSSKYLNTGFASNALSGTSNHIFVEGSGFETSGNPCAVGVFNGDEASILALDFNNGASGRLYRSGRNSPATIPRITTGLISSGSFCGTRPSSASASIYQNGSPANTNTTATSPAFSDRPMFVFAFNNIGSPSTYTAARLRAVTMGSGLSDAQVSSLHTAISTYMSSLL
jgi:hypothetical protein